MKDKTNSINVSFLKINMWRLTTVIMYKYMLEHEKYILGVINSNEIQDWGRIKEYHKIQIEFLQHERLIHLIITLFFAFFMAASYIITVIYPQIAMALLDLILTVLEVFYIIHYYRLENGVQRWYKLYNKICEKQGNK